MKKIWRKVFILGLILVLCMSSILTTQAAKRIKSKSVSLETTKVTLSVGDVVTLRANMNPVNSTDTIKWSSSNKKTATVNQYGVVTALKEGSVTITAKTTSKKTAQCKVTIKKYLTSSEITNLIKKQCLSEASVKKLIKANSLSEENVVTLIKQNSIDQETVKTLIKNSTISEETVKKLISENTISEETVKELISENTISEEAIKSIVAENTLTEEKVKEIVEEKLKEAAMDWEDGTELELYGDFLPYQGENGIVISDITIKKYHCTDTWKGEKQKYKYVLEIDGTMPEHSDNENYDYWAGCYVRYLGDFSGSANYFYPLLELEIDDTNIKGLSYVEEENGAFHAIVEQYNIYEDYDSFMIYDLYFSCGIKERDD